MFTLTDENANEADPMFQKIATALFPRGLSNANQRNDVAVVWDAVKWHAILVTNDGGSKNQPGGILGNASKLKDHVKIMRDNEAADFIHAKIQKRDEQNRHIHEHTGLPLPEWTGKD